MGKFSVQCEVIDVASHHDTNEEAPKWFICESRRVGFDVAFPSKVLVDDNTAFIPKPVSAPCVVAVRANAIAG